MSLLSSPSRSVFQFPQKFSGEAFLPPTSNSSFRQPRAGVVSAAFASYATAESERTTSTCVLPPRLTAPTSFYEVLGIPMGATSGEIKAAYRRLAKGCHPDLAGTDEKSSSADEFIKVHAAYSTLSDPEKRADYDRRLFRSHRGVRFYSTPSPTKSRYSGYSGRNWETDQCW
ncbi:chaperone protein dnaJ 11, chloroplastic [Coffea eugenioides]|uniref:Chaperone protein dnaJ 11, chloroplastic-like n=1 Tax=Coffea arabica TaxID=13443 RepID=A0A6P6TA56_COFAR|nr:chaperone protein dnaJ 11, chloroplastic-like [Coffea arabica]XP_027078383.1 chaperone protein dnaJ 11, chloroplastic-like [Coffea arabica]XP_027179161.1 chaperone protein dnaJ 11, chloroplastic [Coffea eugenioides]